MKLDQKFDRGSNFVWGTSSMNWSNCNAILCISSLFSIVIAIIIIIIITIIIITIIIIIVINIIIVLLFPFYQRKQLHLRNFAKYYM